MYAVSCFEVFTLPYAIKQPSKLVIFCEMQAKYFVFVVFFEGFLVFVFMVRKTSFEFKNGKFSEKRMRFWKKFRKMNEILEKNPYFCRKFI